MRPAHVKPPHWMAYFEGQSWRPLSDRAWIGGTSPADAPLLSHAGAALNWAQAQTETEMPSEEPSRSKVRRSEYLQPVTKPPIWPMNAARILTCTSLTLENEISRAGVEVSKVQFCMQCGYAGGIPSWLQGKPSFQKSSLRKTPMQ
ncbi:GM20808 [Drosophila sechellia]|uniref:GM20808 n=1 Tax=Drosophila sechellia TaxID=7238 RepID=B4HQS2_DROSE|nr:GM20808 [Drosophila sechellia]